MSFGILVSLSYTIQNQTGSLGLTFEWFIIFFFLPGILWLLQPWGETTSRWSSAHASNIHYLYYKVREREGERERKRERERERLIHAVFRLLKILKWFLRDSFRQPRSLAVKIAHLTMVLKLQEPCTLHHFRPVMWILGGFSYNYDKHIKNNNNYYYFVLKKRYVENGW